MAIAGYNIYLGGVKKNTSLVTDLSYALSGLTAETAYNVTVSAVDDAGNESAQSDVVNFTTQAASGGGDIIETFSGTAIDSQKVEIFNLDPSIISFSQNDALILQSSGGGAVLGSSYNNRAEYLSEFNDKDIQIKLSQSGNINSAFAIGTVVDASNLIALIKGSSVPTNIRFIIKNAGTNVVDFETSQSWTDATDVRIVVNQGNVDLYKSDDNAATWIYLNDGGTSYQQDIGSVKKVYFGIGSSGEPEGKTITINELKLIEI